MNEPRMKRSSRHGFTMLETVVVMMIVGLMAAIALPRLDYFKYRADAGATQVRSLLMQAQRDAIVGQHDLIVSIDTVRQRLVLGYDKNDDGSITTYERIRTQALPEGNKFANPPTELQSAPNLIGSGGIRGVSFRTVNNFPSIIFRRDGSVSTPVELYTTTPRNKATDFRVTAVTQATGRTEFYRYNGTSWKTAQ